MRALAAIVVALAALLSQMLTAVPARAHATLVTSEPTDGAVLPAAPSRVTLRFNEPVSPLVLRHVAPDGTSTAMQATVEAESSLAIALPTGLMQGTHIVSWRVVSLDGHPVGGTVVFSIGAPSASPAAPSIADPAVSATLWALKAVFYVGLFVGIGGSFFLAWFAPGVAGDGRSIVAATLVAGLVATPLLVGLQGADALELPLSGLSNRITWETGLTTSFGKTAIAAAIASFAAFFALDSRVRNARSLSLLAMTAAGLALALSGHASAAAPQWLTRPAVFIHTISVTFWVGALVPLAVITCSDTAALARFSRAIPFAVAALVISGVALAIVQVEQPAALLTTAYGQILCAKLVLVTLLLALATWNRFRLTPAVMSGGDKPRQTLARSIRIEIALVVIVLGLVAAWRFTPPPRALAIAAERPALIHIHTAAAMADVTFEPGRAGIVQASIVLMSGDFGSLDAKEVRLTLENKAAGIEAISRPATKGADAIWRVPQLPIPSGGRWTVQVEILVNDFEKITLEEQVDLRTR
jgi:copper transport protein